MKFLCVVCMLCVLVSCKNETQSKAVKKDVDLDKYVKHEGMMLTENDTFLIQSNGDTIKMDKKKFLKEHARLDSLVAALEGEGDSCTLTGVFNLSYCGGAAPSREMLDELNKPHPLKNLPVYLTFDTEKYHASQTVMFDAKGKARVKLKEGTWKFWLNRKSGKTPPEVNRNCNKVFDHPYGSFTVKKGGKNEFTLLFHFDCDPCDPDMKKRP